MTPPHRRDFLRVSAGAAGLSALAASGAARGPNERIVLATFDFPHTALIWEHRVCSPTHLEGDPASITPFGEKGPLIFDKQGWHLGDIAFRPGRVIHFDEKTETLNNDPEENVLLERSYRKTFEVPQEV